MVSSDFQIYTHHIITYQIGDVVYLEYYCTPMVFINSEDVAAELFEKRSRIYSNCPVMGFTWSFVMMPYGVRWRRHRKMFHPEFNPTSVVEYQDVQVGRTREFLSQLLKTPEGFAENICHFAGALVIEVAYGFHVLPGDRYVKLADESALFVGEAGIPGTYLVDIIPQLKYVPEWMTGAGFQKRARRARIVNKELLESPLTEIKEDLRVGNTKTSIATKLLEQLDAQSNPPPDEEELIRNVTAITYQSSETTSLTSRTFVLAMLLHPEAQRKAQAELDAVLGGVRLPAFSDRNNLPYEALRWHALVPQAVHRVTEDDVLGNYVIPKGAIVIGNSWTMLHDEKHYGPHTDKFRPERFLDSKKVANYDPVSRICPGRYFADNTIFIAIASILAVFEITPAKDNNGNDIVVEPRFTSEFLSFPEPFQCSIKPRSADVHDIINTV
ncbi:cytochrome P450 [Ramaria rubella]|nr:cytochrome P450 [Ramaria rubella]